MSKSLASQIETTLTQFELPPEFSGGALQIEPTKTIVPYVVFAQPKATDQWTDLAGKIPGLQDGDPVLVFPEPTPPVVLRPMRFTMVACRQYWVQKDPGGAVIGTSSESKPRTDRWNEHVLAACIVYVQRGSDVEAVPASCVFKTVKCGAALSVKTQIDAAAKIEWAEQSPAHKMAFASLAKPFLRVVGTVHMSKRTAASGYGYVQAKAIVAPATPVEWKALKEFIENDGSNKLRELAVHFKQKLAEFNL